MKFFKFTLLISVAFLLFNCAGMRKLDAALIMKQMKVEVGNIQIDSVNLNVKLFEEIGASVQSLLPNPQVVKIVQNIAQGIIEKQLGEAYLEAELKIKSQSEDSLYIRSFNGELELDSLIKLPVTIDGFSLIIPGDNSGKIFTQFPLDKRLLKINDIKKYRLKGRIEVALTKEGETVPFDFDFEKEITHEEAVAMQDKARNQLLNLIVNDWLKSFLK